MKFFHGTSKENREKIQREGVLWGGDTWHKTSGKFGYRYTYLTPDIEMAKQYGDVVLEVEYEPVGNKTKPVVDYGFDPPPGMYCWQFSVFVPIDVKYVRIGEDDESIAVFRRLEKRRQKYL